MKSQKLLFMILITALCASDLYTSAKNPFAKKPTSSNWDDDDSLDRFSGWLDVPDDQEPVAAQAQPVPTQQPSIAKNDDDFLDRFHGWLDVPDDQEPVAAQAHPVPTQQPSHAKILTLAERKALLNQSQASTSEIKQAPGRHTDPTLTVADRIALREAQTKQTEAESRTKVWSNRIDQDAAEAKRQKDLAEERKRASIASSPATTQVTTPPMPQSRKIYQPATSSGPKTQATQIRNILESTNQFGPSPAPTSIVRSSLQSAEENVQSAEQIVSRDLAKLATAEETLQELWQRQNKEALERGRLQLEHENKVWADAGQIAPYRRRAVLQRIILVIRAIQNATGN